MNVENILKVADAIEQHSIPGLGFNMLDWRGPADRVVCDKSGHNCGTVACIGGWTEAIFPKDEHGRAVPAGETLDLDEDQRGRLFFMYGTRRSLGSVKSDHAVRTLRHLAATGEVNWDLPEPAAA